MKWFFKWLDKKCKQAYEDSQYVEKDSMEDRPVVRHRGSRNRVGLATAGSMETGDLQSNSTVFKLYQANGGTVIETRYYNENKDQWDTTLHVVSKEEELGKAIEHIITYEALKR